jgi:two-component system phosphate regulon sensor histidine kinase PhoR
LRSILDNALDAFETYRHQRSVDLSVDMPPSDLHVLADRGAVSDALLNLLTNAYKYGGDPVKISVACEADNQYVKVKVTDNGAGIPAAEHKRIFQKFYRVDDRLSREREGSGLGLAIVKHVMKAHRGRVELVSHPGKGSTFALVLPRALRPT